MPSLGTVHTLRQLFLALTILSGIGIIGSEALYGYLRGLYGCERGACPLDAIGQIGTARTMGNSFGVAALFFIVATLLLYWLEGKKKAKPE